MKRILITGAGGTPAVNFTRSLRASNEKFHLIGVDCNKYYLQRAETEDRLLVPRADDKNYLPILNDIIKKYKAEFIHIQNDSEIAVVSKHRTELPIKNFLPAAKTVEICMNKFESHKVWAQHGLPQPKTMMLHTENDIHIAFKEFGEKIWIRDVVGAAGKGSLPTSDFKIAKAWLDFKGGWGKYTAAEFLSPDSVTWQSIWQNGKLITAQSRRRLYWEFADRSPSGITGLTGTALTFSDERFDSLAQKVIKAIDSTPHGIFSVDMTLDQKGHPNPTEINIGRFFTTHEFFTRAGLNMPYIYTKLAYGEPVDVPQPVINPLPNDLAWIRGLDFMPIMKPLSEIEEYEKDLQNRIAKI
jgi:carbamoyl-phosphate synthase large subunit